MEEILRKLQKDASGHKHKAIRDACVFACGECAAAPPGLRLQGGGAEGWGCGEICDRVHLLALKPNREQLQGSDRPELS